MVAKRDGGALRIGELAAALGLNPRTIRYYEAIRLLPEPRRTAAGYRLYGIEDIDRLRFVAKAKAIGLSLEEIKEILALQAAGTAPCEHVRALVNRKLEAVDRQLRALVQFRRELVSLRERAKSTSTAQARVCGIIEGHRPVREAASGHFPACPRVGKQRSNGDDAAAGGQACGHGRGDDPLPRLRAAHS